MKKATYTIKILTIKNQKNSHLTYYLYKTFWLRTYYVGTTASELFSEKQKNGNGILSSIWIQSTLLMIVIMKHLIRKNSWRKKRRFSPQ